MCVVCHEVMKGCIAVALQKNYPPFSLISEWDQFLTWSLLSSVGGVTRGARAIALS